MQEFYKRSDDAVLAEKLMRLGQVLAVWLTNEDDVTTFHLMHFGEDGAYIDGKLQDSLKRQTSFFAFVDAKQAEFLLPIDDPVTPLRQEIKNFQADINMLKVSHRDELADHDRVIDLLKTNIEGHKALLEGVLSSRDDRDRKIEILEDNLNRARSEHLEQLRALHQGLEGLSDLPNVDDRLMSAIHLISDYANNVWERFKKQ